MKLEFTKRELEAMPQKKLRMMLSMGYRGEDHNLIMEVYSYKQQFFDDINEQKLKWVER